jgi:transposase
MICEVLDYKRSCGIGTIVGWLLNLYGRSKKGFKHLSETLVELEKKTDLKPCVILEPTGHYHRVLVKYGYEVTGQSIACPTS